jgi:hypothetical protein
MLQRCKPFVKIERESHYGAHGDHTRFADEPKPATSLPHGSCRDLLVAVADESIDCEWAGTA